MVRKYGSKDKQARAVDTGLEPVKIQILEREVTVFPPHAGAFIYLNNMLGLSDPLRVASGLIEFLCSLVEDIDARYIGRLILDHNSGFDVYDVEEILTDLVEDWGERPTKPASGSSPSQATTGKRSTANSRRVGSTRQTSTSPAS
jgi:hypothetical protein